MQFRIPLTAFCLWAMAVAPAFATTYQSSKSKEAEIDEQLGDRVPLDLQFHDETGHTVRLGDLIDRPTIVSLVYFECPSVCRPLLGELAETLGKLKTLGANAGTDYRVLTVSFNDRDTPAGAEHLKEQYLATLPDNFPKDAWTFLTADSTTIARLTQAVGFHFFRSGNGFAHPTSLVILGPDGKITRYLLGAKYLPVDVKMALYEAKRGRVGPTIAHFFQFCFNYDPKGKSYVLDTTRIVGVSTLLGVLVLVTALTVSGKRRKKKVG